MRKLLTLPLLLCAICISAQDVIVKKDGSTIVCLVVELNSSEIVYKRWAGLNGSNYAMNSADVSAINYENGKKVNLTEATNLYTPNNQNDGTQQYNDKMLLKIDAASLGVNPSSLYKKAKTYKIIGICSGIAFVGVGSFLILYADKAGYNFNTFYLSGGALAACGIASATACLIAAHNNKKKAYELQTQSLYQKEFKIGNI